MMNSQFSVEEKFFKITDVTHYIEEKLKIMLYSEKRFLKSSLNNNRIRRIVCLDVESIAKWTTKSEPSDYVYQLSNQTNCFAACRWTWQREIKFAPVNLQREREYQTHRVLANSKTRRIHASWQHRVHVRLLFRISSPSFLIFLSSSPFLLSNSNSNFCIRCWAWI